ncbi:MAG: RHS repeat domain-containing protein [Actinomycetota bacterium]
MIRRLSSVADWLGNTTNFTYDANGNLIGEGYPNGVSASRAYNAADRLTNISDTGPAGTFLNLRYSRDPNGLVAASNVAAEPTTTVGYGYDALGQLTNVQTPPTGPGVSAQAFGYDTAQNLVSLTTANGTTTTLQHDAASQLTSATNAAGVTAFTYDARGNRTSAIGLQGTTTTYGYDQANRLTSYKNPAGITTTYNYRGDGLLQQPIWDLADGIPTMLSDGLLNQSGLLNSYVTGPGGLPVEQVTGGQAFFYHQDQLGSTRALTNGKGLVVATYVYDAYGNISAQTLVPPTSIVAPFGFAGQYKDQNSGLIYMRARWYDPSTGQFLARDPLESFTDSPYSYASNNPINKIDPLGFSACGSDQNAFNTGAAPIASAGVMIYRATLREETAQIAATQQYQVVDGLTGKYFYPTEQQATEFAAKANLTESFAGDYSLTRIHRWTLHNCRMIVSHRHSGVSIR